MRRILVAIFICLSPLIVKAQQTVEVPDIADEFSWTPITQGKSGFGDMTIYVGSVEGLFYRINQKSEKFYYEVEVVYVFDQPTGNADMIWDKYWIAEHTPEFRTCEEKVWYKGNLMTANSFSNKWDTTREESWMSAIVRYVRERYENMSDVDWLNEVSYGDWDVSTGQDEEGETYTILYGGLAKHVNDFYPELSAKSYWTLRVVRQYEADVYDYDQYARYYELDEGYSRCRLIKELFLKDGQPVAGTIDTEIANSEWETVSDPDLKTVIRFLTY